MDSPEVTFTLAYLVFAVCFVFTPTEFHSAGLTVQNLLSGWLGSEDAAFVPYHLRRTSATLLCHSLLPLGYYVGMCFAASEKQLYSPSQAPEAWQLFLLLAVTLPTVTCTLIYYWSWDRWACHPLARTLALYALPQSGWWAVASSVNTEFRRIDKFATGAPGARVIVTDTWVMKVTTYRVHVAQQQDVHLTVTESQQHELSPDSNLPVQLLTIHVASTSPGVQAFDIRLNSTEYGELCEKLRAPIRSAANVVIRQSLGDLFLETFASLVEVNPVYSVPSSQVSAGRGQGNPRGQSPRVWGGHTPCDPLGPPTGAGGLHRLHADACQREAGEDLPGGGRGRVPAVLLPPHVVSHLHGQVVRQPPGPAAP
ncbi:E3 ubiquitin-protein ligase TM129 isoform X3 [Suricata suricatta]|uniref:E3 ubiquitin-protein ligase TM129 isoform X3 n=1 Tax=Suricata suricatta TaxID=37032 RepID=UPI0011557251|nr:E3 ubiquitin-protein ligase TM129 isoform X3 [Suricata suricatta]